MLKIKKPTLAKAKTRFVRDTANAPLIMLKITNPAPAKANTRFIRDTPSRITFASVRKNPWNSRDDRSGRRAILQRFCAHVQKIEDPIAFRGGRTRTRSATLCRRAHE